MDFKNAQELLELCTMQNCTISAVMKARECMLAETTQEAVESQMAHALEVMRESVRVPVESPRKSIGGLIGGEAQMIHR